LVGSHQDFVGDYLRRSAAALDAANKDPAFRATVEGIADAIARSLAGGGKLMLAGNGGSAADAQHLAAEFLSRFVSDRQPLPAIALTTDTSVLTAIGNDYGFDLVFKRQVEALAASGDAVVGISTSGNSPNVLKALQLAHDRGCRTIGLLGKDGGSIKAVCDLALVIPSSDTPRIQEGHITIIHIVCDLVEKAMFG
jgi:D-sedoheptulose 7-phosphate isomerase